MKRLLIVLLIPLLTLCVFAKKAEMKFDATEINFGDAEDNKIVDMEFKFVNAGDDTLIIKNVQSSCGCTVVKPEKNEYKPGEKGVLPVKFNTQGYSGTVTKTITISTNDEAQPYTQLKITGNIKMTNFASIELEGSDEVNFKDTKIGKEYPETVTLRNSGTIPLKIMEISHGPEIYPIFNKKELAPGEGIQVKLVFKPMQDGRFASFMKIYTNAYRQRILVLKIVSEVAAK